MACGEQLKDRNRVNEWMQMLGFNEVRDQLAMTASMECMECMYECMYGMC